ASNSGDSFCVAPSPVVTRVIMARYSEMRNLVMGILHSIAMTFSLFYESKNSSAALGKASGNSIFDKCTADNISLPFSLVVLFYIYINIYMRGKKNDVTCAI